MWASILKPLVKGLAKSTIKLAKGGIKKLGKGFKKLGSRFFKNGGIDATSESTQDIESLDSSENLLPKKKRRVGSTENNSSNECIDEILSNYDVNKDDVKDKINHRSDNDIQEAIIDNSEELKRYKGALDKDQISDVEYSVKLNDIINENATRLNLDIKNKLTDSKDKIIAVQSELMSESIKSQAEDNANDSGSSSTGILGRLYDIAKVNLLSVKQSAVSTLSIFNPIDKIKETISNILNTILSIDPFEMILTLIIFMAKPIAKIIIGVKNTLYNIKTYILDIPRQLRMVWENTKQSFVDQFNNIKMLLDNFWDWLKLQLSKLPVIGSFFTSYKVYKEYVRGNDENGVPVDKVIEYRKFYYDGKQTGIKVVDSYTPNEGEMELAKNGKIPGKTNGVDYKYLGTNTADSLMFSTKWTKSNFNLSHREQSKLPINFKNVGPYAESYNVHDAKIDELKEAEPEYRGLSDGYNPKNEYGNQGNTGSHGLDDVGTLQGEAVNGEVSPVVNLAKSFVGKLSYSPDEPRFSPWSSGHTDCSGFVSSMYRKAAGINIGNNTNDIFNGNHGKLVDRGSISVQGSGTSVGPNVSKLLPGDLLFYRRSSQIGSRKYGVGHVNMYIGDGKMLSHSGGIGPKVRSISSDAKNYIGAKRFITTQGKSENQADLNTAGIDNVTVPTSELKNADITLGNSNLASLNNEIANSVSSIMKDNENTSNELADNETTLDSNLDVLEKNISIQNQPVIASVNNINITPSESIDMRPNQSSDYS